MIPLLGAPLVGKRTVIEHLARRWPGLLAQYNLPVEIGGHAYNAVAWACHLEESTRGVDVWCLPGGTAAEWPLALARQSRVGVLVLDPQITYADRQQEFLEVYLRLDMQWCVILGKQDFLARPDIEVWDPAPTQLRMVRSSCQRTRAL